MKVILILALFCLAISQSFADDKLECYQCPLVTQECEVSQASVINCGKQSISKCSRQVKKGTTNTEKALRKCVVPDKNGQILCPDNYDCTNCDDDLCNAGSVIKYTWFSLAAVFFIAFYI